MATAGDSKGEENEMAMTTAATTVPPTAAVSSCLQSGNGDRDHEDEDEDAEEDEDADDDTRTRMAHLAWGGFIFSFAFLINIIIAFPPRFACEWIFCSLSTNIVAPSPNRAERGGLGFLCRTPCMKVFNIG